MTRILVYEWCAGGAARGDSPRAASLWLEGWAMLAAAVEDCRRIPDVRVQTILDADLRTEPIVAAAVAGWPDVAVVWTEGEPAAFQSADVDFALIIAPEFDRILETRCRWAVENGATLLGPSPDAVALTADKLALARHLQSVGVPTPETTVGWVEERSDPGPPISESPHAVGLRRSAPRPTLRPSVIKPRFGVGSQETYLVAGDCVLPAGLRADTIVQPFISGRPASVAFLIGPRQTIALMPAWQDISTDGRFHYRGGSAPLPPDLAGRATRIARQAIGAVKGLAGYVGVDVILGDEGDYVIEINPRLTTSYIGLRVLAEDNLMDLALRLVNGEKVAEPRWKSGHASWTADGKCSTNLAPP